MIIPDINLLLYAYDADSSSHPKVSQWWATCLSRNEPIGIPLFVAFGFVRIGTNARIFQKPMTLQEASGHVRSWFNQPVVSMLHPAADHIENVFKLLEDYGLSGNSVSDAQLAALAVENHAVLHTADSDFSRFAGLKWFNPLTGVGSRKVGRR
jgi:toxin-antitoxin system PIN domain toxin